MNYKTIIWALLFIALKPCMAQSGYMEMKMTSDKAGTEGTLKIYYSSVGNRTEIDTKMGQMPAPMHMIVISKKSNPNIVTQVNEAGKTYTEMDVTKNKNNDKTTYTVKKVGDETVNGYKCVHVILTNSRGEVEDLWSSKDVADYEMYHEANKNNPRSGSSENQLKALKEVGAEGFPVRIITKRQEAKITMDLVKVEKKAIPASMFDVPADYKKQEAMSGFKTSEEMQKMSPEERAKYFENLKNQYGK